MKKLTPEQLQQARKQIGEEIGHLGGKARAASLTPKRRTQIARAAAKKRWDAERERKAKDEKTWIA